MQQNILNGALKLVFSNESVSFREFSFFHGFLLLYAEVFPLFVTCYIFHFQVSSLANVLIIHVAGKLLWVSNIL